jgi:hypothetical protein
LDFGLFLFSCRPDIGRVARGAGLAGLVVDWENREKDLRQAGTDTQINSDSPESLRLLRASTDVPILCRINSLYEGTEDEIETALAAGADEILLPMVRTVDEVQAVLQLAGGRCGVGILIETEDAVRQAHRFAKLPLRRVYVGLNDLAIDRGERNIFRAVLDGTVERVRRHFSIPFGFGGLTLPERGDPIPCRLLMGEMIRLGCHFSFLRRSFFRDTGGEDLPRQVSRIHEALRAAEGRSVEEIERDRAALHAEIDGWEGWSSKEEDDAMAFGQAGA